MKQIAYAVYPSPTRSVGNTPLVLLHELPLCLQSYVNYSGQSTIDPKKRFMCLIYCHVIFLQAPNLCLELLPRTGQGRINSLQSVHTNHPICSFQCCISYWLLLHNALLHQSRSCHCSSVAALILFRIPFFYNCFRNYILFLVSQRLQYQFFFKKKRATRKFLKSTQFHIYE